jgi:putative Mg2+ transporter-C (MgtC) family protein
MKIKAGCTGECNAIYAMDWLQVFDRRNACFEGQQGLATLSSPITVMLPDSVFREVILRMVIAVLVGCVVGVDRNLRGKPTGVKTLGLVALGACLVTMAGAGFVVGGVGVDANASRAIQGIVTGVGFLGAGVIVQNGAEEKVRGLTTAASIWVTAALGVVCGVGAYPPCSSSCCWSSVVPSSVRYTSAG